MRVRVREEPQRVVAWRWQIVSIENYLKPG